MSTYKKHLKVKFSKNLLTLYTFDFSKLDIGIFGNNSSENIFIDSVKFKGWIWLDYKATGLSLIPPDDGNAWSGPLEYLQCLGIQNDSGTPLPDLAFNNNNDAIATPLLSTDPVDGAVLWFQSGLVEGGSRSKCRRGRYRCSRR